MKWEKGLGAYHYDHSPQWIYQARKLFILFHGWWVAKGLVVEQKKNERKKKNLAVKVKDDRLSAQEDGRAPHTKRGYYPVDVVKT